MFLRTRIMIGLNALLLVTVLSVSGLTLFTTVHSLRERAKRDALGTASLLASVVATTISQPGGAKGEPAAKLDLQRLIKSAIDAGNLEAVFVVKPDGQLGLQVSESMIREYYASKLDIVALQTARTLKPTARFRGDLLEACVPLAGFGEKAGALVCKLDTKRLDEAVASSLQDIAALSFAGIVAGALLATLLARRISGPIQELAKATNVIGSGEFGHRVRVVSNDEVGMLAESFNKMADSLEEHTARLAQAMAEKEALQREMDIAAEIQRSLLPESCPSIEGFELAAQSIPAREVGGDFYDFIPLPEGRWGLVVADVSGKGVPAALLMALSRSLIRSYSQDKPSILGALRVANSFVLEDTRSEMFVTCFYAVIDPSSKSLTYVNAGHNPPVITRSEGSIVMLPATGAPLGILDEPGIEEQTCQLDAGDVVLMYTDGITEAQDACGEEFGIARLQEILKNFPDLPAGEIAQRVIAAAQTFAEGHPQFDDMTAVLLKVL
ncbi:MAG: SpoIIE family protein phosphatase [Planctomycetota bacterium]